MQRSEKFAIGGIVGSILAILGLIVVKLSVVGFVLWLLYKLVMHVTGGDA